MDNLALRVTLEESPAPDELEQVRSGLMEFNRRHLSDDSYRPLTILARDSENKIVGGLLGAIYWGVAAVDILWLDDAVQGKGIGSKMMGMVEEEARKAGCGCIHLDTMSFQARGFYEKLGFRVFGVLAGYARGASRYYLVKELRRGESASESSTQRSG